MFEEFFERCEIQNAEKITEEQSENIKAALREKLAADNSPSTRSNEEKEKNIMKTKAMRTFIIAAAVAAIGAVGVSAAGVLLTREEIAADLATKNSASQEYVDKISEAEKIAGRELHSTPWYSVMNVTEFAVRAMDPADYKGWEDGFTGIIFEHVDEDGGGLQQLITSDGNGGYLYMDELITDEKLLAAIAEGTEKYGDTFIIMY